MPPKLPELKDEPESVWIALQEVAESDRPDEYLVQFKVHGEQFVSFVPRKYVNFEKKQMFGVVFAEYEGSLLVEIPAETLTSGPRMQVPPDEIESLLTYI